MSVADLLEDHITRDVFEDPILLPCCGQTTSRASARAWLSESQECSLCRGDLSAFDPETAPTNVVVRDIIDALNGCLAAEDGLPPTPPTPPTPMDAVKEIQMTCVNTPYALIGKMDMKKIARRYGKKQYIIAVVDTSGSMQGQTQQAGAVQAKQALDHLLNIAYADPQGIDARIIFYDSVALPAYVVDTGMSIDIHRSMIARQVTHGGGTEFDPAFQRMIEAISTICKEDEQPCPNIHFVFMTDGAGTADTLNTFTTQIRSMPAHAIVHTCGFGTGIYMPLLESLYKCGKEEGQFRLAAAQDTGDELYAKMASVFEQCTTASKQLSENRKIRFAFTPARTLSMLKPGWVRVESMPTSANPVFLIVLDAETDQELERFQVVASENAATESTILQQEWYSLLLSDLVNDISTYQQESSTMQNRPVCLQLILKRYAALQRHSFDPRLEQLSPVIQSLRQGTAISTTALNDMKNVTLTTSSSSSSSSSQPPPVANASATSNTIVKKVMRGLWENTVGNSSRGQTGALMQYQYYALPAYQRAICQGIQNYGGDVFSAAFAGHYGLVTNWSAREWCRAVSAQQYTISALELAACRGMFKTVEAVVRAYGSAVCIDPSRLGSIMSICIDQGWYTTLQTMIEHGLISSCSDSFLNSAPQGGSSGRRNTRRGQGRSDPYRWRTDYAALPSDIAITWQDVLSSFKIHEARYKEEVAELRKHAPLHWVDHGYLIQGLIKNNMNCLSTVGFLIQEQLVDPHEFLEIAEQDTGIVVEKTWLFFIACERGLMPLFDMLLPIVVQSKRVDEQNMRGATALWIAACNGHEDIVTSLLETGAKVNLCNHDGNSPLVATCERNQVAIAKILLEIPGIDLFAHNKNRDNIFILCCRKNHHAMLNLLLSHANEEDKKRAFEEYATIDGFSPVFAAVEMDHDLSLQVLIQHGARLDVFTGDDNQIIAGAGPCHLAAFYGRIKCLEVLQKQGIDVIRVKDKAGNTPLHIAVKRGQRAVMQYLLAQAPVDIIHAQNDAGESPIQLASKEIFEEYFVNALIRNIHEYIATSSTLSATKSTSLLTELVRYGHSLGVYNIGNERLDNGWSLLTCCLVSGHISTALELISDGASLDAKDDYGLSPRMWLSFMRALAPSHWCAMVPSQYFYTEGERLIEAITTEYTSLQDKLLLRLDWTGFDTVYLALTNKTGGAAISSSSSSSSSSPPASSARHIDLPPMRIGGGGMEDVIESRMITSIRKQLSPTLLVDVRLRMLAYLFSERERGITDHLSPSAFVLLSTMPYVSPSSLEEYSLYYHRLIERLPRYKEEEEDQQRREVYAHSPTSDDTIRALFSAEHIQWTSWMQPFQGNWTQWSSRKQGVLFILPCSASSKLRDVSSFISEGPALKSYMFPELSTTLRIKCFYKYNMCVLGQKNIRKNYLLTKEAALVQLMNDKSVIIAELEEE